MTPQEIDELMESKGMADFIFEREQKAKAVAYEECAKIARDVADRELEVSRDYKGHMMFQSQCYRDAAFEIEGQLRERARGIIK